MRLALVPRPNDILDSTLPHGHEALLAEDLPFVHEIVGHFKIGLATAERAFLQSAGMGLEIWAVLAIEIQHFVLYPRTATSFKTVVPDIVVMYATFLFHWHSFIVISLTPSLSARAWQLAHGFMGRHSPPCPILEMKIVFMRLPYFIISLYSA